MQFLHFNFIPRQLNPRPLTPTHHGWPPVLAVVRGRGALAATKPPTPSHRRGVEARPGEKAGAAGMWRWGHGPNNQWDSACLWKEKGCFLVGVA